MWRTDRERKIILIDIQIMSIENCPLTQIPTEIVSGGPSLVIQVNIHTYDEMIFKILIFLFLVPETPRSLQNYVLGSW